VLDQIVDLVNARAIEVIHFHHFLGIGTDGLIYLRHRLPHVGFVFTAHEYLSLCARDGQMLMSDLGGRCTRPQFDKCAACVKLRRRPISRCAKPCSARCSPASMR
jgi:hypothetical protein